MASTVAVIPRSSFQSFTPFTRLPLEIRCIIWRLTLLRRIVEIFPSESGNGFYSRATLPVALQVCQESKRAVEHLYPAFFGSFLQPESIRFNVNLDILYLDIHLEQECLLYFLGMLKETELRALKYVALDAEYLYDGYGSYPAQEGLKRAMKAMVNLKEMLVSNDVTENEIAFSRLTEMGFFSQQSTNYFVEAWPSDGLENPREDSLRVLTRENMDWRPSASVKMESVFGLRLG